MKLLSQTYARLISRRSFLVVCLFIVIVPLITRGARQAAQSNSNDVTRWLPDAYPETEKLNWYQERFNRGSDHVVVVSFPECRLGNDKVQLLAEKLRARPDLIDSVIDGPEMLDRLTGPEVGLDEAEALRRLQGSLIGPEFLHGMRLRSGAGGEARVAKVEIGTPAARHGVRPGDVLARVNGTPTPDLQTAREVLLMTYEDGTSGELSVELQRNGARVTHSWPWSGQRPHRQTCLLVALNEQASREQRLRTTLDEIRRIAAEECDLPHPDPQSGILSDLRMGGPPVDNEAINIEGDRTLMRLAVLSFGVGLVLCLVCLRNLRLTLIVFFTALFSELTSLSIVWYSGGTVDAILMSMPSLIYVLTISGAIHIVNYYRDVIQEDGLEGAPAKAVAKGFMPCSVAAATTAVGMASLYISDLVPIRGFGVYSAVGVMTSLLWTFLFLPAALQLWGLKQHHLQQAVAKRPPLLDWAGDVFRRSADLVLRFNGIVMVASFALLVFFGYGLKDMRTTVKLMNLFDDDSQIVHNYEWLESKLGALVPMEVVLQFDTAETVTLKGAPTAGSYVLEYLGEDGWQPTAPIPFDASGLDVQKALRAAGLKGALVRTSGAPPELTHRVTVAHGGNVPFLRSAEDATQLVGGDVEIRNAPSMLQKMQTVERAKRRIESLEHVDTSLTATTFAPDLDVRYFETFALNKNLTEAREGYVKGGYLAVREGVDLFRISLRMGAFDNIDYSHFVQEVRGAVDPLMLLKPLTGTADWQPVPEQPNVYALADGRRAEIDSDLATESLRVTIDGRTLYDGHHEGLDRDVTYTGIVPLVYKAQNELLNGLFKSYGLAFGLIGLVMVVLLWRMTGPLKSLPAALFTMMPNLFPTVLVFGFMAWMRWEIDIGTMMTASVALGVAVDDTVHYLTWFRRGAERGLNRREAARVSYRHCALAMTQTTLVAGFGMATFAFSTFQPTCRFGVLMLPLMAAALLGDLVMLPAMLVSGIGRFFTRGRQATPPPSPQPPQPAGEEPGDETTPPFAEEKADRRVRADRSSVKT